MTSSRHSLLPVLLVLLILSVTTYLVTRQKGDHVRQAAAVAKRIRSAPDISLTSIRQTFVEQGRKKWMLQATSAYLSRNSRQTRVKDIAATFFSTEGKPFEVTADEGLVSFDTRDAEISGNVIIHHQGYKMYTQSLRYQAENHIITTNGPVKIESDLLYLTGDRLRYDLATMKAELAGNVNGIINENLTRQ